MSAAKSTKKKSSWGGTRPNAGRKKKKVDPPADPPPVDPPADPPPVDPPADPPPVDPPADPPPVDPPADPPPVDPPAEDDEIDFSKYKRAEDPKQKTPPLEDPVPPSPPPPGQGPIVVINGMMLMQILNFLAPPIFSWVMNFGSNGYISEDFELEEHERKVLEPAANVIAHRLFARMPPEVQFLVGYGVMSFSGARKKKKLRGIGTRGKKSDDPKIMHL